MKRTNKYLVQTFRDLVLVLMTSSFFVAEVCAFENAAIIQSKTAALTPQESLLPMIGGLFGVLAVILILAFLLKKVTGANFVSSNMRVIESQSLGAKEKLIIVEIQNKQYVLGVTAHNINKICELTENINKPKSVISFDAMFKQLMNYPKNVQTQSQQSVADEKINEGHSA